MFRLYSLDNQAQEPKSGKSSYRHAHSKAPHILFHLPGCFSHRVTEFNLNGFKVTESSFRLGVRKKFFPVSVMRPGHRLPKKSVAARPPELFKARLDKAWNNLGY